MLDTCLNGLKETRGMTVGDVKLIATPNVTVPTPPRVTVNNTSTHDYQGQHAELQNNKCKFYKVSKMKEPRIRRPTAPIICISYNSTTGTRWRIWSRHCATNRKVAGSIPDGVIGNFHWHNPSSRTIALGLTQPLTEMNTTNISLGVKAAGAQG